MSGEWITRHTRYKKCLPTSFLPRSAGRLGHLLSFLLRPSKKLETDRKSELEIRVMLGYYDRPEVREKVAARLAVNGPGRESTGPSSG